MLFHLNTGKRTVAWQQKMHFKKETEISSTIFNNVFSYFLWQRVFQKLRHPFFWCISCPSQIPFLFWQCKTDYKWWTSDIYISVIKQNRLSYVHCKYCCSFHTNTGRNTCEVNNKKKYNPYKYSEHCWQITCCSKNTKGIKSIFIKYLLCLFKIHL